ncbi:MAG: calcium-binding protein [Cyanobacteria bacterium J06592_8]
MTSSIFQLTTGPDNFTVFPGQLTNFPEGLAALDGNDSVTGSANNDLINGNQDQDTLSGGGGVDTLFGGQGEDELFGQQINDLLFGNKGLDNLDGGDGNDSLFGGQGQDALVGGAGNDTLSGDKGEDFLIGNEGADVFVLNVDSSGGSNEYGDFILDFDSTDLIGLAPGLTAANLSFEERSNLTIEDVVNFGLLPVELGLADLSEQGVFNLSSLFSPSSGTIEYTEISANGQVLAAVVNQTPDDLANRIISVQF